LLLPTADERSRLIEELERRRIGSVFHYGLLHSLPAGRRHGRFVGELSVTDDVSARLVRLPLWVGMTDAQIDHVIASIQQILE
jgi:dTDP-4-amino-4,6-dideoxygalactose transaminase